MAFGRSAFCTGLAAALLAACALRPAQDDAQPPTVAPNAMTRALASASRPGHGELFVDDAAHEAVEVLSNNSWKNVSSITKGIDHPLGNWVDRHGNLYVANSYYSNVTEYSSSGSPKFTYSSNMLYAAAVTTDRKGNVYEADEFAGVNEYRQGINTVVANCPQLYDGLRGVAVDSHGDVFVSHPTGSSSGAIVEYKGGLTSCSAITLGVTLGVPSGIALDKNGNLLVCDESNRAVDVIGPPYSHVSGHLGSNYGIPVTVAIDRDNDEAFVTDWGSGEVDVLTYPVGTKFATLGSANGLEDPVGTVDASNYVP